jgi:hypothetical protein
VEYIRNGNLENLRKIKLKNPRVRFDGKTAKIKSFTQVQTFEEATFQHLPYKLAENGAAMLIMKLPHPNMGRDLCTMYMLRRSVTPGIF